MKELDVDGYLDRMQREHMQRETDYEQACELIEATYSADIITTLERLADIKNTVVQYYDQEECLDVEDFIEDLISELFNEVM